MERFPGILSAGYLNHNDQFVKGLMVTDEGEVIVNLNGTIQKKRPIILSANLEGQIVGISGNSSDYTQTDIVITGIVESSISGKLERIASALSINLKIF